MVGVLAELVDQGDLGEPIELNGCDDLFFVSLEGCGGEDVFLTTAEDKGIAAVFLTRLSR